jgi:hypothetical protein
MMINYDGNFYDYSTGMTQDKTVCHKTTCYQISCDHKCFVHALQINYIMCIPINHHK